MSSEEDFDMPLLAADSRARYEWANSEKTKRRRPVARLFVKLSLALYVMVTAVLLMGQLPNPWSPVEPSPPPAERRFEESLLLTLKTGSAVLYNRSPVQLMHLSASRKAPANETRWHEYIPNQLFYSDAEEWVGDVHIRDVLQTVAKDPARPGDVFDEYRRLHSSLSNHQDPSASSKRGSESRGWELDKYKFLPLHADAARRFPDVKYTVSVEADTFLFWNQLVKWLKERDREGKGADELKMWGNGNLLADISFAHGGSGYVISRGVVQSTFGSDAQFENNATFLSYLDDSCCGDAVLAQALQERLPGWIPPYDESEPRFIGESPALFNFVPHQWCEAVFTLHGITAFDYVRLDRFRRTVEPLLAEDDYIRRADLWEALMPIFLRDPPLPLGQDPSGGLSIVTLDDETVRAESWRGTPLHEDLIYPHAKTAEECHEACVVTPTDDGECLMWTFDNSASTCYRSPTVYIGQGKVDFTTGYHKQRIDAMRASHDCSGRLGNIASLMAESHVA